MKEIIKYSFWGTLAAIVNIVVFNIIHLYNDNVVFDNLVAWFVSVVFCYITNALFVFENEKMSLKQFNEFALGRISTFIVETIILFIFIRKLMIKPFYSKVITNIVIGVLNYILTKVLFVKTNK